MKHLRDIDVLVLGLGDSGLAMARWCARNGARVRVWDSRDEPPQAAALAQCVPQATRLRGALGPEALDGVKLVLKSPGLAPADERIARVLSHAAQTGIAVQGELDLFVHALADLRAERGYVPQVLAITGTNGKTTTTAMTGLLVARAGRRVAMAGNIGPSMLTTLGEALDLEPAPAAPLVPAGAEAGASHDDVARSAVENEAAIAAAEPNDPSGSDAAGASDETSDCGETGDSGQSGDSHGTGRSGGAELDDAEVMAADDSGPTGDVARELDDAQAAADVASQASDPLVHAATGSARAVDPDAGGDAGDEPPETAAPRPAAPPAPVFEHLPQVWVLELSSFQLDGVRGFEPDAAAVLNVTQDHLDWHGSLQAYAAAKASIFGTRAVMVLNRDDPLVEGMASLAATAAEPAKGRGRARTRKPTPRRIVRFGLDAPHRPGDFGLVTQGGMAWLVRSHPADPTFSRRKDAADPSHDELHLQRLMPADALRVRGRHNAANALAALALATAIDCPLAPMLHGLREYRGEPHRVEHVATIDRVDAFDDSKGTNVGATVAAIEGLGADRSPAKLVVLLGGDGKGQDFSALAEPVRRHARAIATLGRDAERIEAALADCGVPMQRHASLEAATRWAFEQARTGDAVLLSPACASLDMFRNYGHRAEVFVQAVHALLHEQGAVA
jgi:UDP-N-acetylmuramoylalanine--D-glutamate ligase